MSFPAGRAFSCVAAFWRTEVKREASLFLASTCRPYAGRRASTAVLGAAGKSGRRLSGGYCGGVPPLPIPNREVKPACADGTAMQCGRVGRRLLFITGPRVKRLTWGLFFVALFAAFYSPNRNFALSLASAKIGCTSGKKAKTSYFALLSARFALLCLRRR